MTCEKINVRHKITLKPVYITQIKSKTASNEECARKATVCLPGQRRQGVPVMS